MAVCDIDALTADAVANRFAGLSERDAKIVELQLWYLLSGSDQTIKQLQTDACASGFACVWGRSLLAAKAQLLCNLSEGLVDNCVNIVPAGAAYSGSGGNFVYNLTSLLNSNTTYQITFGANESFLDNSGEPAIFAPGIAVFTTPAVGMDVILHGVNPNDLVTATICEVIS